MKVSAIRFQLDGNRRSGPWQVYMKDSVVVGGLPQLWEIDDERTV